MTIQVKLEVSETSGYRELDLDDLGLTKEEWENMNGSEKFNAIKDFVFELPEQPYWCVDSFNEK